MKSFEKFYTVDDISRMKMLSKTTIRNYIREGILKGSKIKGQWLFCADDIENMYDNKTLKSLEENEYRQDVIDFIDGVNTNVTGVIQVCSIVDYYCDDTDMAKELCDIICKQIIGINSHNSVRFHFQFIDSESKARFTFFAEPVVMSKVLFLIEERWRQINRSSNKFKKSLDLYDAYRPFYSNRLTNYFIQNKLLDKDSIIAEIGCSAGKLTELLLVNGNQVFAVEPNKKIRIICDEYLSHFKKFYSVEGNIEKTTILSNSIDFIFCAESYHCTEDVKSEFKRILKQDGHVCLIWTVFEKDTSMRELYKIVNTINEDYKQNLTAKEEFADRLFGKNNWDKVEFDNPYYEDVENLKNGICALNFFLNQAQDCNIKKIFASDNNDDNKIKDNKMKTVCYHGKL